jgi:hypothetical protein
MDYGIDGTSTSPRSSTPMARSRPPALFTTIFRLMEIECEPRINLFGTIFAQKYQWTSRHTTLHEAWANVQQAPGGSRPLGLFHIVRPSFYRPDGVSAHQALLLLGRPLRAGCSGTVNSGRHSSLTEVVRQSKIFQQSVVRWRPTQGGAGLGARGRAMHLAEVQKSAKIPRGFLGGQASDR